MDVAGETFLVAWRRWDEALTGGLPWLYRTAGLTLRNQVRGESRQQRARSRVAAEPPMDQPGPFDRVERTDLIVESMRRLSRRDQEILMLSYWEDLTTDELMQTLDCSRSAVHVRLHRARSRLRRLLPTSMEENS